MCVYVRILILKLSQICGMFFFTLVWLKFYPYDGRVLLFVMAEISKTRNLLFGWNFCLLLLLPSLKARRRKNLQNSAFFDDSFGRRWTCSRNVLLSKNEGIKVDRIIKLYYLTYNQILTVNGKISYVKFWKFSISRDMWHTNLLKQQYDMNLNTDRSTIILIPTQSWKETWKQNRFFSCRLVNPVTISTIRTHQPGEPYNPFHCVGVQINHYWPFSTTHVYIRGEL